MPPGGSQKPADSGPRQRAAEQLAESIAMLLKTASIYLPTHPRVAARGEELAERVAPWLEAPNWFAVRVRGDDILVDRHVVAGRDPTVKWLAHRLRDAGLAGVEFGPKVDGGAVVEFARAVASCSIVRNGRTFAGVWPPNHSKVRPLDLVFTGGHSDAPQPEAVAGAPTVGAAVQDVWKIGLVSRLSRSQDLRDRLHSLEQVCEQIAPAGGASGETMDVIASIVDLLPADIVRDPSRVDAVVARAIDQMQLGIARLLRDGAEVDDAGLMRSALGVAKKYFGKSAGHVATTIDTANLPTGRPEDECFTPDGGIL